MRRAFVLLLALLAVGAVVVQSTAADSSDEGSSGKDVLEFDVMTPVVAPFTGAPHAIRGVPGGGLPWEIDRGRGELRSDGRLEIRVEGLVLARRDPVPANLQGTNPIAMFRGVVNCLTTGSPDVGVNLATPLVPATRDGNARIRARVELPDPCVAPIVFVTSPPSQTAPNGSWFATTGR